MLNCVYIVWAPLYFSVSRLWESCHYSVGQKIPRLYGTRRFLDLNLNLLNPTHTLIPYFFKIRIDVIFSSASKPQNRFLPLGLMYQQTCIYLSILSLVLHSTPISYVTFKTHSNLYLIKCLINRVIVTELILKEKLISVGTSDSISNGYWGLFPRR
jgi:hypothetical protein